MRCLAEDAALLLTSFQDCFFFLISFPLPLPLMMPSCYVACLSGMSLPLSL